MLIKHPNLFKSTLICILRLSTFCVLFGRGCEHLITDVPFRTILWDQDILENLIKNITGLSWEAYTSSSTYDYIIDTFIKTTGGFYLICSTLALFIKNKHKHLSKLLIIGSLLLTVLSLLFYKSKFLQIGQFIEYACQMLSPLFLYVLLFRKMHLPKFNFLLKTTIALTFAGHGLYALGIYPTPGMWTDMALSSLNFIGIYPSIYQVQDIIYLAGILDMVLAVGIFLSNKWSSPFLIWAVIWGLLTALSRVIGFINIDASWHTLIQWLPQTIVRLPHVFIPLAVLTIIFKDSFSSKVYQKQFKFYKAIKF